MLSNEYRGGGGEGKRQSFLRGLITKSQVLSIFNSSDDIFLQFEIHIGLHTRFRFTK